MLYYYFFVRQLRTLTVPLVSVDVRKILENRPVAFASTIMRARRIMVTNLWTLNYRNYSSFKIIVHFHRNSFKKLMTFFFSLRKRNISKNQMQLIETVFYWLKHNFSFFLHLYFNIPYWNIFRLLISWNNSNF